MADLKPVSFSIHNLQRFNRLRWLFLGVFLLTSWLVLQDMSRVFLLIPLTVLGMASILFFGWAYERFAHGKSGPLFRHGLEGLVFWQTVVDIVYITVGTALTGGPFSLFPLVYLLYFGALETYLRPIVLLGLNGLAIVLYLGVIQVWVMESGQAEGHFLSLVLLALVLNAILVAWRSRQLRAQQRETEHENNFLTHLNMLSRTAIADVNDKSAFVNLADEIKAMLGADNIYITRWDEESEQVLSLAADSAAHKVYMDMAPSPRYENTFTRSVKRLGRLVVAENTFCSPYVSPKVASHFQSRAVLAVPMFGEPENRFLGALLVSFREPRYFSSQEIVRARQVTDILSLLVSRTWLYEEVTHRAELLEKMAGQVTSLVSDLKRTTLLPSIVESARSLLQAQRAALHLQQPGGEMKCEYSVGLSEEFLEQLTIRFNQLAGGKLLQNRDYVIIPDVTQDSRTNPVQDLIYGEKFRAYAVFSLSPEYQEKGALSLYWDQPYAVSADEIAVARLFSERASAIIRSAHVYARATEEALTDILTDLPNRRHLDRRIQEEMERASRYGHTFALLMIDLDGFKGINDTFGHPIGDSVLKQVAVSLRRTLRASDFLARYGGDEFSIILPEAGLERALHVAEKLRLSMTSTRLHLPHQTQRYLSACMGVAIYPKDCSDAGQVIACADARLYRAKRSGSGSIIYKDG